MGLFALQQWSRPIRRMMVIAGGMVAVLGSAQSAFACFAYAPISLFAGEQAVVCENIFPAFVPGGGGVVAWQYQYFVSNTSVGAAPPGIDFFGVGVNFALPAPGAAPSFSAGAGANFFGLVPNASVPFLNGESNTAGFVFDEYDNRPAPAAFPTGYFLDWNDNGNGDLPGALVAMPGLDIPAGAFREFDLFSPFGPVTGYAVVDPLYVDDIAGHLGILDVTVDASQILCQRAGGPTTGLQGDVNIGALPACIDVPEPSSLSEFGVALLVLAAYSWGPHLLALRRRRRSEG
jgi:hypothetical protein